MPHLLDGAAENISSKTDADARGKLKISKARHASDAAPRNQLVHVVFVPDDVIFIIKRLCGLLHVGISCHHNVGQGLEDTRSGVRRYEGWIGHAGSCRCKFTYMYNERCFPIYFPLKLSHTSKININKEDKSFFLPFFLSFSKLEWLS